MTGAEWRRVDGVQAVRPRRHPGPGGDAGEAIRRVAHQPDPARQLGHAKCCSARSSRGRPRTCRGCPRTKRHRDADRAAARREAHAATRSAPAAMRGSIRYGFALEGFDAIGRARDKDLADRPIDTRAKLTDGTPSSTALDGLRNYLLTKRRDAFAPAVLPQAARLRAGPQRAAFRRTAAGRDADGSWPRTTTGSAPRSKRSSAAGSSARSADVIRRLRRLTELRHRSDAQLNMSYPPILPPHLPPRRRRHDGPAVDGIASSLGR